MTIQITEQTTAETIYQAHDLGVKAAKVYPRWVTTNSENGVVNYYRIYPALDAAQKCGMVACFHCEHPSFSVEGLYKEAMSIPILEPIVECFSGLKLVVEHVTTQKMLDWVRNQSLNVRATITAHHLKLTLDDVIGYSERSRGLMRVHHRCKPQPKFRADMLALQDAAVSGDPHFFYGGDDAPHLRKEKKECAGAACGVFNTPVAIPVLIDLFQERGALQRLNPFLSHFGAGFYGYPRSERTIAFEENPWVVPEEYPVPETNDSVVPLFAGETMRWQICS